MLPSVPPCENPKTTGHQLELVPEGRVPQVELIAVTQLGSADCAAPSQVVPLAVTESVDEQVSDRLPVIVTLPLLLDSLTFRAGAQLPWMYSALDSIAK